MPIRRARLRDQNNAPSASAYKDLGSAQRFTQTALDDIDNADRIEKWIERVQQRERNNPAWDPNNSKISPPLTLTLPDVTGRTVERADYDAHGMGATAGEVHSAQVALKYRKGMAPLRGDHVIPRVFMKPSDAFHGDDRDVISHTGTLFNDGPVRRVVETALRARESQGALDLDDELRRFVRTMCAADTSRWLVPVASVAALLDHTADLFRSEGAAFFPRTFTERLDKARDGVPGDEYLRTLAGLIRMADQEPDAGFADLPLADWEAAARFPELFGFGANWIYDGEYPLLSDSIAAFIEVEHPFCSETFSRLAADAQSVLVLFPEPAALSANVTRWTPWASHDALRQITRSIDDHMRTEHSGS